MPATKDAVVLAPITSSINLPMMIRSLLTGAMCFTALLQLNTLGAQALPRAPSPLPTDTEVELRKINDLGVLMQRAEKWRSEGDLRRYSYAIERLVQLRPYSPNFQYALAQAYALRDEKTKAYDTLIKIQKQGLALNPDKDSDFDKVRTTPVFKYIVDSIVVNETPWGEGSVVTNIQNGPELIESVVYDKKRDRFLAGSVRTGAVVAVDRSGKTTPFASPATTSGLKSVFALAVDEARGFLWVGTAGAPQFKGFRQVDLGTGALLKFELASGKLVATHKLPFTGVPRAFGSIAVAGDGTVYATDAISNVVYQVKGNLFRELFAVPESTSLRGLSVSPDHKFLYFADYELGLRVADLGKSEVRELSVEGQNLGGIDGLYYFDNHLIAIQNGTVPTRVIRISVDKEKGVLKAVQPLEANKDQMPWPTFGAVSGDDVYFIANSQRDLYGADGKPLEGTFVEPRAIYKVNARFAWAKDEAGVHAPLIKDAEPAG